MAADIEKRYKHRSTEQRHLSPQMFLALLLALTLLVSCSTPVKSVATTPGDVYFNEMLQKEPNAACTINQENGDYSDYVLQPTQDPVFLRYTDLCKLKEWGLNPEMLLDLRSKIFVVEMPDLGRCTAWLAASDAESQQLSLVTNNHCFPPGGALMKIHNPGIDLSGPHLTNVHVAYPEASLNMLHDVAFVNVPTTNLPEKFQGLPPIEMAPFQGNPGDEFLQIAYPGQLLEGRAILAQIVMFKGYDPKTGLAVFEGPSAGGASGSPIINHNGEVVALVTSGNTTPHEHFGEMLTAAIPFGDNSD